MRALTSVNEPGHTMCSANLRLTHAEAASVEAWADKAHEAINDAADKAVNLFSAERTPQRFRVIVTITNRRSTTP